MVNDGIGNGNFTTLKPFAFWTQHVLPLVYGDEISYMETLGKMRDILNELIKNNNNLPEYIQRMIEEYISSGAIEEVIDKILSNFILNVKYPPTGVPKAKGDGTANDHDSIQGCIDYAAGLGGGVVYLPAGKYLTSSLVLKPGVTLLGFGKYATSLILAGGATTHLITGTVSDAGLLNLTLNAKMSSQVNRVDAVELFGNHIEIRNVVAKDCYTSINVQKNGTAITISNVLCETASDACLRVGGTDGGLLVDGLEMTGLSTNLGVAYLVSDSNGDIYRNINIHGTGALGIDVSGSQNYFDGKISGVTKDYEDLSGDNTFELFGKSSVKNYTNDVVENANAFSQVAANGIERQGANIIDNAMNTHSLNAKDVILNPTNPLTYKTPTKFNKFFDTIDMKDSTDVYKVLVAGEKLGELGKGIITPENYGAVGDGVTDDTEAIKNMISDIYAKAPMIAIRPTLSLPDLRGFTIFMKGVYLISEPMTFTSGFGLTIYNVNLIASSTFTGTGLLMFTVDMRNCNICNGKLMCNYNCDESISIPAYNLAFIIDNVQIFSYKKIGIHNSGDGFETVISNCNINQVEYGHLGDNPYPVTEGTGIKIEQNHTDCHILNTVTSYNFNYEVYIEGGVSTVADCHFYGRTSACFIGPYHELSNVYFDNVPVEIADNNNFSNCVFSKSVNTIPYLIKLAATSYYYTRFVNCTFRGDSSQTVFNDMGATSKFIGLVNSSFVGIPAARYQTERSTGWQPWSDTDLSYGNPGGAQIGQMVFDWGTAKAAGTITLPRPFDLNPFFVSVTPIDSGTIKVDSYTKDSITVSGTSTNFMWFALGTT